MRIETGDHGGIENMLRNLKGVYGVKTLEEALKRGVEIATVLASHADQLGHIHLIDKSRPEAPPYTYTA